MQSQRRAQAGALGDACAGDSGAGGARAHGACAKGSRNAGSSVESLQGASRGRGALSSGCISLLRKWKLGGKGGAKSWIIFRMVTPTFAFIHPFMEDHRILCKGTLCGKIHHPFHAKTKQNFTNQDAFAHLALSLSWMMFKTM